MTSVTSVSRRLGVLVAATAAFGGLTALSAPLASAAPPPAPVVVVNAPPQGPGAGQDRRDFRREPCRPVHRGPDWHWHESRRGGHWDHKVWNRRQHRVEWQHVWRDDRRCLPSPRPWGPPDRGPRR